MKWLLCLIRGRHSPRRAHSLGGFKCEVCNRIEADLDGFDPSVPQGYINPLGKKYDRQTNSIEKSARW